jgi:ferredoxin-NADP reductase
MFMTRLRGRREVASGTMAFDFDKPADWHFEAGQFVDITLLNPTETDSEGDTRHFSIASAPRESTLLQQAREKRSRQIFFFYANRRPEDAPFLDELRGVAGEIPSFTFVPTMTGLDQSDVRWEGERGRIDQVMLAKYLKGVASAMYYVTGPPGMVKGLVDLLMASGVDADDIRTEEFTGY